MRLIVFLLLTIVLLANVSALCSAGQIDINTASLKDLEKIKWVGNATAQKIVDARPFSSVDDLKRVSGLGGTGKRLTDIKAEGLACVENEVNNDEEKDVNANTTQDNISTNNNSNNELAVNVSSYQKIEPQIINLNYAVNDTKGIKTEENSENLGETRKNKIALYGFFVFSAVIIILLFLRKSRIYKNDI